MGRLVIGTKALRKGLLWGQGLMIEEAEALINQDPHRAAEIYIDAEKSKLPLDFVEGMLHDPENVFTTTPQNVMKYAAFMAKTAPSWAKG